MIQVPPERIAQADSRWQPELFATDLACVLDVPSRMPTLGDLSQIIEGSRGDPPDAAASRVSGPMYRPGNIQAMHLVPSPEHLSSPTVDTRQCVQPGDVVVTKNAPPRAALVPELAHRHPADGNCLILRGLTPSFALWAAWCLNTSAYGTYLTIMSRQGPLPRITQATLGEVRLPEPPAAVVSWAHVALPLTAEAYALHQRRGQLLAEVHAAVVEAAKPFALPDDLNGGQWIRGDLMPVASLLPSHVHLSAQQHRLRVEGGWQRVSDLVIAQASSRQRLAVAPAGASYLRLGDVALDGTVATNLGGEVPQPITRVFAQPVQTNEVLLATIVTAPRAALIDAAIAGKAWVTDQFLRLRFQETPAAWAMILGSPPIADQMRRMAVGTIAQYANPADLLALLLPPIPLAQRQDWDRRERQITERRRTWDVQWGESCARGDELFRAAHRILGATA